jgi:hypothetical protein
MAHNVLQPVTTFQSALMEKLAAEYSTPEEALKAASKYSGILRKKSVGRKVGHLEGHMNLAQAIEYFGVSQKTLERWHAAKKGPKRTVHKSCVYYSHKEIARWRESLVSSDVLHPVATEKKS